MTKKFVSSGAHFCAVIATMNLVLMAAIANDESVGNRTTSLGFAPPRVVASPPASSPSSSSGAIVSPSSQPSLFSASSYVPVTPSIQSLVRSQTFETLKGGVATTPGEKNGSRSGSISSSGGSTVRPAALMALGRVLNHDNIYNSTISSSSSSVDLLMNSSTSPFVTLNSTVLKAQYKSNALLPCNVRNSGDGVTVSWIRRKDYHLLTVGLQTYSSDDRFAAIHASSPDDWTLKIKYVQQRDAGTYECQVSTHPPSSIFVTLIVVEARAKIVGGPEKFYKAGSSVELRCDLIDSTEEPEYVFWYQGLRMINYDPIRHINVTHSKTSSMLVIHNVQKTDSGNYTCVPSNAQPASIFVHIINGENPAAMQHGSHSTTCVPCPPLWFLSFLLSLTLQTFYLRFLSRNVDHNHHHQLQPTSQHYHHSEPATTTTAHCDDDKEEEDVENGSIRGNNINGSKSHHSKTSTTHQSHLHHHNNNHNQQSYIYPHSFVDQVESQSTSNELTQRTNHSSSHSRTKACQHQQATSSVLR